MKRSEVTLKVLTPRGKIAETAQIPASRRLGELRGKKIGVLNNSKIGGEMLLPYLEEALKKRIPSIQLRIWKVPFAASQDLKEPKLKEIAEYSDGVIALMGD